MSNCEVAFTTLKLCGRSLCSLMFWGAYVCGAHTEARRLAAAGCLFFIQAGCLQAVDGAMDALRQVLPLIGTQDLEIVVPHAILDILSEKSSVVHVVR
uniref:Uncharacterized protein n=1 Tax=Anguilla anguilla TaxID=7936 RepID=A0A0E9XU49_ANGAN